MNRPIVVAHRGVATGAAENTIAAFTNAIDIGADMIEFDVRRTRDGELITFHDARMGDAPVSSLTRDEITAAGGVRPPLLTEVLEVCSGRIRLDVEFKEDGYVPEVMAALKSAMEAGQLIVTSFLPPVIAQVKDIFPEVKTGLLVGESGPLTDLPARLRELYPVALARKVISAQVRACSQNAARRSAGSPSSAQGSAAQDAVTSG